MAEICLALIFVGLTMYAVLGGADFGAGLLGPHRRRRAGAAAACAGSSSAR